MCDCRAGNPVNTLHSLLSRPRQPPVSPDCSSGCLVRRPGGSFVSPARPDSPQHRSQGWRGAVPRTEDPSQSCCSQPLPTTPWESSLSGASVRPGQSYSTVLASQSSQNSSTSPALSLLRWWRQRCSRVVCSWRCVAAVRTRQATRRSGGVTSRHHALPVCRVRHSSPQLSPYTVNSEHRDGELSCYCYR